MEKQQQQQQLRIITQEAKEDSFDLHHHISQVGIVLCQEGPSQLQRVITRKGRVGCPTSLFGHYAKVLLWFCTSRTGKDDKYKAD